MVIRILYGLGHLPLTQVDLQNLLACELELVLWQSGKCSCQISDLEIRLLTVAMNRSPC